MRIVLDTNIFISAVLGGRLGVIVDRWKSRTIHTNRQRGDCARISGCHPSPQIQNLSGSDRCDHGLLAQKRRIRHPA